MNTHVAVASVAVTWIVGAICALYMLVERTDWRGDALFVASLLWPLWLPFWLISRPVLWLRDCMERWT